MKTLFKTKYRLLVSLMLSLSVGCHQDSLSTPSQLIDGPTLCDQAASYIYQCTGETYPVFNQDCNQDDAELLLSNSCDILSTAANVQADLKADTGNEQPFTCQILGLGCKVDTSCFQPLSDSSLQEVIELSDINTLGDEYDVRSRIEQIAYIFMREPDPRGIFSIVYRLITNNAVASVEEGLYENSQWTRELIIAFAKRYLVNLHGHLTNREVSPQWQKYYKLAQNCQVGYGRILGIAIATHLMVDLPYALEDVDSAAVHEADFMLFGEVSLRIFPNLIEDMQEFYQTDVSDLLQGFFLGEWVDSVYTKGTATTFIYQTVRANAWRNSQNLTKFPRPVVKADIDSGWGLAEIFLATLDAINIL